MPQTTDLLKNSQFHNHERVNREADNKSKFTLHRAI